MDELTEEQRAGAEGDGAVLQEALESAETEESGAGSMDRLRELVAFLKASGIAEFDLERAGLKLRLKFQGAETPAAAAPGLDMAQLARLMGSAQPAAPTPAAQAAAPAAQAETAVKHHIVKSPLVGTIYEAPSPGAAPFVKVGDMVEVGTVLCIVEAMKLMNEIESDAAGEIVARIVPSGQPVEYGQPLFEIKTV